MSLTSEFRNLTVLIIDDQMSEQLAEKDRIFDNLNIKLVTRWADSQSLIQIEGDMGGADILLIDVSFDTDDDISKAKDSGLGFLPIGPILALPYISKRTVMACVIYSAHILNEDLHKHPYFLIPMGLILSRTERNYTQVEDIFHSKYLSINELPKYLLDNHIKYLARDGASNTTEALKKGLEDYREKLSISVKSKHVLFINSANVLSKISELQKKIDQKEDVNNNVLLDQELTLRLVGNNWNDNITLVSIFADRIRELGRWGTKEILEEISDWIINLGEKSFIEQALVMIKIQEESDGNPNITNIILNNLPATTSDEDLNEILRLCILFANIWAIENPTEKHGVTIKSIYEKLGNKVEQNTYYAWFGERRDNRNNHGRFKGLQHLSTGSTRQDRCFLTSDNKTQIEVQAKDYEAIQKYRTFEGFPQWETCPFKLISNFS